MTLYLVIRRRRTIWERAVTVALRSGFAFLWPRDCGGSGRPRPPLPAAGCPRPLKRTEACAWPCSSSPCWRCSQSPSFPGPNRRGKRARRVVPTAGRRGPGRGTPRAREGLCGHAPLKTGHGGARGHRPGSPQRPGGAEDGDGRSGCSHHVARESGRRQSRGAGRGLSLPRVLCVWRQLTPLILMWHNSHFTQSNWEHRSPFPGGAFLSVRSFLTDLFTERKLREFPVAASEKMRCAHDRRTRRPLLAALVGSGPGWHKRLPVRPGMHVIVGQASSPWLCQ